MGKIGTVCQVARRECRRMTSRRLYVGVCLVLPLFCLFFMATIFGSGQMEEIPVGVVDMDNTATSRSIVRRIEAVPTFRVTERFTDEAAARESLQRKEIYGYLVIPQRFEEKSVTGKDATLAYYYHYALLSVGSELMAAFENALAPVAVAPIVIRAETFGVSSEQMQTILMPIESDTHPLYNPDMNYAIYLSQPFFFVLFQILILLTTVYAVGHEVKTGTAQEWLRTADGSVLAAVIGKLLPYTIIYMLIGIAANSTFFGLACIPFTGSLWLLSGVTILFILATQALAVFIFGLYPKLAYIISVVSMVGSLGATLSGVTFPVTSMYAPVRIASYFFPVRHFVEATQALIYFDAPFPYIWQSVAALLLFPLAALIVLPRIFPQSQNYKSYKTYKSHKSQEIPPSGGLRGAFVSEWRTLTTDTAILLVLSGGIFLYGLLYNYMYAPNLVRKTPIAVVDGSHTTLSRKFIRLLDATPQTAVTHRATDLLEARRQMTQGTVAGILYLPRDFQTLMMQGNRTPYILYASTNAFLHFKNLNEACTHVMLAMNTASFNSPKGEANMSPPLGGIEGGLTTVCGTALYNPTEGYGTYLIPAVLIVIIFQTMLMVVSMRNNKETLTHSSIDTSARYHIGTSSHWRIIICRTLVYVTLYALFSIFLLGFLPHLFGIPHIGRTIDIVVMMIPFLFATAFLGMAASRWFTDAESPLLLIAYFSVGYIFLSGVSYPLELMPWWWKAVHYLFPVTPAVLAFVKLDSMGASLTDILPQLATLWLQVILYGFLAFKLYRFGEYKA